MAMVCLRVLATAAYNWFTLILFDKKKDTDKGHKIKKKKKLVLVILNSNHFLFRNLN